MNKYLFIIDGHNFAARAWYGGRQASKAFESQYTVNVARKQLRGNLNRLSTELEEYLKDGSTVRLVMAIDRGKTWRHAVYVPYKAKRPAHTKFTKEFFGTYPALIADEFGVELFWSEGNEADDVMATMAVRAAEQNWLVRISSTDHDMLSVANNNISIVMPAEDKKGYVLLDADGASLKKGFPIERLPFAKSLQGDVSDNYPGVRGLGIVAATRFANRYVNLQSLLDDLEHVGKTEREKIDKAMKEEYTPVLFEKLATLNTNVVIKKLSAAESLTPYDDSYKG